MTWTIEDYEVYTRDGVIQSVKRTGGASIPADMKNSDYYEFTVIDTENHLCTRTELPVIEPDNSPTIEERTAALEDMVALIVEGGL